LKERGKHPTTLSCWGATFSPLARELAGLRYDALARFLQILAGNIGDDAKKDEEKGRHKLAETLDLLAGRLFAASKAAEEAWNICQPHEEGESES
jgi:hypothetical protein